MTNDELLAKLLETYALYYQDAEEHYESLVVYWVTDWIQGLENRLHDG